jgi:6-phosphogluconolactonase (cycloisomerase 2 family)
MLDATGFKMKQLGSDEDMSGLAAGLQANNLTTFKIDHETGGLTKLAEYPTGDGPNWIEFVRLP